DIINPYFMNEHYRMNYEWYAKQVLELNNITEPNFIKAGETLKRFNPLIMENIRVSQALL
ncbi:MAG: hypothetical protein WBK73_06995, partial [Tepidanaerobacteraceae bacterium]